MTTSRLPEISDELLSAYIDNMISESERALVDRAVQEDATVAWRLATLGETVRLLRALPVLQAPRSFVLTAEQAGEPIARAAGAPGTVMTDERISTRAMTPQASWWERLRTQWRDFWQAGNPVWRNAMATSMAALLVLLSLPVLLADRAAVEMPAAAPLASLAEEAEAPAMLAAAESPPVVVESPAATDASLADAVAPTAAAKLPGAETPATNARTVAGQTEANPENAATDVAQNIQAPLAAATPAEAAVTVAESAPVRTIAPRTRAEDPLNPGASVASGPVNESAAGIAAAPPGMTAPAESALQTQPEVAAAAVPLGSEGAALEAVATTPEQQAEEITARVEATSPPAATVAPTAAPEIASPTVEEMRPDVTAPASAAAAADATFPPPPATTAPTLRWLQLGAAFAVAAFAFLWWRSGVHHP